MHRKGRERCNSHEETAESSGYWKPPYPPGWHLLMKTQLGVRVEHRERVHACAPHDRNSKCPQRYVYQLRPLRVLERLFEERCDQNNGGGAQTRQMLIEVSFRPIRFQLALELAVAQGAS